MKSKENNNMVNMYLSYKEFVKLTEILESFPINFMFGMERGNREQLVDELSKIQQVVLQFQQASENIVSDMSVDKKKRQYHEFLIIKCEDYQDYLGYLITRIIQGIIVSTINQD